MSAIILKSLNRVYELLKLYSIVAFVGAAIVSFISMAGFALGGLSQVSGSVLLVILVPIILFVIVRAILAGRVRGV